MKTQIQKQERTLVHMLEQQSKGRATVTKNKSGYFQFERTPQWFDNTNKAKS